MSAMGQVPIIIGFADMSNMTGVTYRARAR
jgi:hypothetical protein